jgi:hypothetical protein
MDEGLRDFTGQFGDRETVSDKGRTLPLGCFVLCNSADHDYAKRAIEELLGQTIGHCVIRGKSRHERSGEIQNPMQLFNRELPKRPETHTGGSGGQWLYILCSMRCFQ